MESLLNSIPVRISPASSPRRSRTTTSGIVSCWLSNSPWKSGDIGWRELFILSKSSLTTGIWSISGTLNGSTPDRPAGRFSSPVSTSPSPTDRVLKTPEPMRSRLSKPSQDSTAPEAILPPALFVSPIEWSLDEDIRQATLTEPAPPGGPEGKTFVPTPLRLSLLDSLHSSLGSGHPGSDRTLSLLQRRYWWPTGRCPGHLPACQGVLSLRHFEDPPSSTSWETGTGNVDTAHTSPTLVPRRGRFHHWPAEVRLLHLCPRCGGSVFEGL